MSVILETKQLCKFYGAGENQVKAVNQVDIQIEQGEFVAIVGKSGSGKSTVTRSCSAYIHLPTLQICPMKKLTELPRNSLRNMLPIWENAR